jgi:hypothetical protein
MTLHIRPQRLTICLGILIGILASNFNLYVVEKVFAAAAKPQTLTGAQAQKSPQADVFLAYEKALLNDGIDAASVYMTPERLADMQEMLKQFGPEGFKDFQAKMRASAPQGEARRKQIETLVVEGDSAVLTARTGPNMLDEVRFVRTKDGWKISKGRF